MKILRHIGFIVVLLMGFVSSSFSAAQDEGTLENSPAPQRRREWARSLVRSFYAEDMESFLGNVPAAEVENLVHNARKIINPSMDGRDCLNIINTLYGIPGVDERTRLIDFIVSTPLMMENVQFFYGQNGAWVISLFSQIPSTERAEIVSVVEQIEKASKLSRGNEDDSYGSVGFLQAVRYVRKGATTSAEREHLLRLTQQLFSAKIPSVWHSSLLEMLEEISGLEEKDSFVRFVSRFMEDPLLERLRIETRGIGNSSILRNLAKLPNDTERTKVLRYVDRITPRHRSSEDLAKIMEVFAGFPAEEDQESFVAFLSKAGLFADDMSGETYARIIKRLHSISDMDERKRSLNYILTSGLIPQAMDEYGRNEIIQALLSLSNETEIRNFEEFLRQNGLISEDLNLDKYRELICALGYLPAADRQSFLDFIIRNNIVTPTMSSSERAEIISECISCQRTAERRQRLLTMALPFMTPNMTVDDKVSLIQFFSIRLNEYSSVAFENAELLASYALQLITPGMTSHDHLSILEELSLGRGGSDRYFNREMLDYRLRYASEKLHEATLQGLITQDNIFTYTHEFLKEAQEVGPLYRSHRLEDGNDFSPKLMRTGAPINIVRGEPIRLGMRRANGAQQDNGAVQPANIDVVGQEAISAQRRAIKETYETLATSEETSIVISRNLPSLGAENEVFVAQTTRLNQVLELLLKTQRLPDAQKMKVINALLSIGILTDHSDSTTIARVRAISPEIHAIVDQLIGQDNNRQIPRHGISNAASYRRYSHPDLPNIRQFFALVYNLLDQQMGAPSDPNEFTRSWLAETFANNPKAWGKFKVAFYHDFRIALPGTVGEALALVPSLEVRLASCLENLLKGEDLSESLRHKDLHIAVENLAKSYGVVFKERYTPLIEALAMIMRGHNNDLDSLRERNNPACAEGAYLGIIKVLQEIPNMSHIVGTSLAHIDVVACAGVAPAMPDISAINLGAAQDTAEQARALREVQDAEYAASLAVDQERDRLRAEQQQSLQAAAATEETVVETSAERRARLAAAADARLAKK